MKKFTSLVIAAIMLLTYVPFVNADAAYETKSVSVPYTKTKLTAEDFGMTTLYTDETFSSSVAEVTPNFGDKVYAADNTSNYVITPVITYTQSVDSKEYYFEFNGNFETNTEKGAYNLITPSSTTTEEYEFIENDTILKLIPETAKTQTTTSGAATANIVYALETPITLKYTDNWKISVGFTNINKIGYIIPNEVAFYEYRPHYMKVKKSDDSDGRLSSSSAADTRNIAYYRMSYENKPVSSTSRTVELLYSRSATGDFSSLTFNPTADATYRNTDTTFSYLFSRGSGASDGWGAMNGTVDYLYIQPDLYYNKAMEYVNQYNTLLSKSLSEITDSDATLIAAAVDAYDALSDGAKSKLVRGEYAQLMALGKLLANGDATLKTAFGSAFTAESGDGTEANPYIVKADVAYNKESVTAADFETNDRWADVTVTETPLNSFVNEVDVKVTSAQNNVWYKFTVYPVDESVITNDEAKAFITQNKAVFRKTEVTDADKTSIGNAITALKTLSDEAKAALTRNEMEALKNLYLKTIFETIKLADTKEELLLAVQNEIGVYATNDLMAEYIISIRPASGFAKIEDFDAAYNKAVAVKALKETTNLAETITDNAALLKTSKVDIAEDYKLLSDAEKTKFAELAANINYANGKEVGLNLREAMILAEVKCADSAASLKNAVAGTEPSGAVINNNLELTGADLSVYNSLTYPEKAYTYMYANINSINTFADIKTYFEQAAVSQQTAEAAESGTPILGGNILGGGLGSGSVNSGGGGGGNVISSITTDNQVKEEFVNPFSDMENHWGKAYVLSLAEKGMISGYADGTFKPDNNITRAEFVKIVTDVFEINGEAEISFADVSANDWFNNYIKRAVSAKLIMGNTENKVMPNNNIVRQDAVLILYRYLATKIDFKNKTFSFKDTDEIADYALAAVNDMAYAGIVSGSGSNRFNPNDNMTRAEAAVLISNAVDYIQGGI